MAQTLTDFDRLLAAVGMQFWVAVTIDQRKWSVHTGSAGLTVTHQQYLGGACGW